MKILEVFALTWLDKQKATEKQGELVLKFAREVQKLMGIEEDIKNEKN